jgi:hypothetical protein
MRYLLVLFLLLNFPAQAAGGFCDIAYVRSLLKENMELLESLESGDKNFGKEKPTPIADKASPDKKNDQDFGKAVEALLKNDFKIYTCVLLGHFKNKLWKDIFGE